MSSIITLGVEECQENFDFVFSLVERGHTIKILSGQSTCLLTPLVTAANGSQINIPDPEEFVPDPAMVTQYVSESLTEMTKDF